MTMENLMKALMESATQSQQGAPQQAAGGDALSQVIGGLMGGQQAAPQQAGGDALSQVLGGLLGGGMQQGGLQPGGQGDQMLGVLEQIIGGRPGMGQSMAVNQSGGLNVSMNDPVMSMLQPVVSQLAAKANIQPQIAMVVASIAIHYLLSSHPSTSPKAPMDLGQVMRELQGGNLSQSTLNKSGMIDAVMQATGLNQQQAARSLNTTFEQLGAHVQGTANPGRG